MLLETIEEVERALLAAAPGAAALLERLEALGGAALRRGRARLAADLDLRRRLMRRARAGASVVSRPDEPSPWSVSSGSTAVIVREWGAISSARPPVAITGRIGCAELVADAVDDRVDLAGEAVDEARLERRHGRLADHALGGAEGDLAEPRRAREERVHRDLDPRREHAAGELARRRDDVEVGRGAEVDDDRRGAVALARRHGVGDPVGPDLARVVVADRHAGRRRPGPSTSSSTPAQRSAKASYSPTSRGTDEQRTIPSSVESSTSAAQQHRQLVGGLRRVGADPELRAELVALEETEDGLRVADVDREQHRWCARGEG